MLKIELKLNDTLDHIEQSHILIIRKDDKYCAMFINNPTAKDVIPWIEDGVNQILCSQKNQ